MSLLRNFFETFADDSAQYDVHLCAYSMLLQIVAKFHDEIFSDPSSASGLNKVTSFLLIVQICS